MHKQEKNKTKTKIATPYLLVIPKQCIACWKCLEVCPQNVLTRVGFLWHKHIKIKNPENCIGCNRCVAVCPKNIFIPIETPTTK